MDQFRIQGGNALKGTIEISGAKNSVLLLLCASILCKDKITLQNVPDLKDVRTLIHILESMGAHVILEHGTCVIDSTGICSHEASYEWVKQMRASICLLGPLIGVFGQAKVSLPGGCVIGPRPVDVHLKGLRQIGCDISVDHGYILAKGRPKGGACFLGGRFGSSVTATANLMMASVLGGQTTYIESAAMEPEISDLAYFLNSMGAQISGIGSHLLKIEGVHTLHGCEYKVLPDRIEAGTFMIAAAITGGEVTVTNVNPQHLGSLIDKMTESGTDIHVAADHICVKQSCAPSPIDIITLPYPGFPTDLQAQMMAYLCLADGISVVTERVYTERFMHVMELNRLGANIALEGSSAIIKGPSRLSGAPIMASDLRASAALVLAALKADGESVIERVYHIDRGYEQIESKLSSLGASIRREKVKSV